MDAAIVLDCEEMALQEELMKRGLVTGRDDNDMSAIARRIQFFKQNTLPAIKHFDDQGKLFIVSSEASSTHDARAKIPTLNPMMLLACSVNTPIHAHGFHLLCVALHVPFCRAFFAITSVSAWLPVHPFEIGQTFQCNSFPKELGIHSESFISPFWLHNPDDCEWPFTVHIKPASL